MSSPNLSVNQEVNKPSNTIAFAFLLVAFLTGIASSFQIPTLSLFLSQEINVSPFMVGLFYAINAIMGIFLSQILARYSNQIEDRRKMIMYCCLIAMFGCLIFAYSRNYYVLVILGTSLLGLGASSNPQSFALAREYANSSGRESVMFTTIMRTQISLAWIIGPPLSFSIASSFGFSYMYLVSTFAFLGCAVISITMLPKITMSKAKKENRSDNQEQPDNSKSVLFLFITTFLMWSCNGMYLINMPLYVINTLHLSENLAGILMGTVAGLEIPIMLLAGFLSKFLRKKILIYIGLVAGFCFYFGLLFATQAWQLMVLQLLNAICVGIIATIGMVYFQDLMPQKMGSATTLFGNAAKSSWIISGPLAGVINQWWDYEIVFGLALIAFVISIICFAKVKSV